MRKQVTQTVVIDSVEFDNVSLQEIQQLVADKKIYRAVDGKYYVGHSLEFSEMDFTAFVDSDRIYAQQCGIDTNLD
jgi:hypothetical protein